MILEKLVINWSKKKKEVWDGVHKYCQKEEFLEKRKLLFCAVVVAHSGARRIIHVLHHSALKS